MAPLGPIAIPLPTGPGLANAGAALTVAADGVYFVTGIVDPSRQSGIEIAHVPLVNGVPDPSLLSIFPTDRRYAGGPLVNDGIDLYFPRVSFHRLGFQGSPEVVVGPLDGDALFALSPLNPSPVFFVNDLSSNGDRGVFFQWNGAPNLDAPFAGALDYWNGTETRVVAAFSEGVGAIEIDREEAFVETASALYSVALPDGPPVKLRAVDEGGQLFGLNVEAVFFAPDRTSILRRDRASGVETVLVDHVALQPDIGEHTGWADSSWLYYVTGPEAKPDTLSRVRVGGGAPEIVWNDLEHPPSGAVATDACNIYWLTASRAWDNPAGVQGAGPSVLMVRAKQ
jgi:hypothetical protein